MTDLSRTPIVRRHICEVCHNPYTCTKCSEYMERGRELKGDEFRDRLYSPQCMQKFVCPDCEVKP